MTGFEVYKLFLALNNHFFQPNYDYFRYNGGVPVKPETYEEKRQDEKHRYDRLAKKFQDKEELENFLVANMIEAKKRMWIGALFGGEADDVYTRWQGRIESLTYNLVGELKPLLENDTPPWEDAKSAPTFNGLFECGDGQHPPILKAHMRGDLSLESFVLLDMCLGFVRKLDKKLGDDRNWLNVKIKATKYRPFLERLNIDVGKLSKAIRRAIEEMGVHN